jgi:3-deoxy-D-manno-octulosonic acid kinase
MSQVTNKSASKSAPKQSRAHIDGAWIWTDGSVTPDVVAQYFLQPAQRVRGQRIGQDLGQGGRGQAFKIDVHGQSAVLRYYQRGGWMAHVNQDKYFGLNLMRSRSYEEFDLMTRLANSGILVPRPLAAMALRVGAVFYKAALMTRWVDHQSTLAMAQSEAAWYNTGRAIAQLHYMGVWHADLNVHNILIDHEDRAWMIDFDRARENVRQNYKFLGNLARLRRSINKFCPQMVPKHWPVLLEGYDQA